MDAPARARFLGHSTVLVEIDGIRILTDPLLVERLGPLRRVARARAALDGVQPDVVLISHGHYDHLHLPSLRLIGGEPRILAPAGLGTLLARHGYAATEVMPGDRVRVAGITIETTSALHHGGRGPLGPTSTAVGFRIEGSSRVYFAGDTDLFPAMKHMAGSVEVALLPVWGWGPTLGPGHLDPRRAAEAVALIRPDLAIPIHWGTFYPLGLARLWPRPLEYPPVEFAAEVARIVPATEVRILTPGTWTALPAR